MTNLKIPNRKEFMPSCKTAIKVKHTTVCNAYRDGFTQRDLADMLGYILSGLGLLGSGDLA